MAWLELEDEVFEDFDRFLRHMALFQVPNPEARIEEIIQALHILTHSPTIGRPSDGDTRELVIGRGTRGYVARYRFDRASDTVYVLAIRSQREADFRR